MTTTYSKPFDELTNQAQQYARELGTIPSQNKLKAALHVRSERARAVLAALRESGFDPKESAAEPLPADQVPPLPDEHRPRIDQGEAQHAGLTATMPPDPDPKRSEPVPSTADQPVSAQVDHSAVKALAGGISGPNKLVSGVLRTLGTIRPEPVPGPGRGTATRSWPIVLLAAPAMVAIWSGWVGLGVLTGFGMVHPLPGIADGFTLNSAITLPIGVETYAAYALRVWLATGTGADQRARFFAKWSAIGSLALGAAGQVAYHLMTAQHVTTAPWEITTAVACLPVIVLGFGAALAHLQHHPHTENTPAGEEER